jgi:hypothetical protein
MLRLREINPDDYIVFGDGQLIGRLRYARDRTPEWLWTITVTLPGPPFGDAKTIEEAKQRFESAWLAFKEKHGPVALQEAFYEANLARPGRYGR